MKNLIFGSHGRVLLLASALSLLGNVRLQGAVIVDFTSSSTAITVTLGSVDISSFAGEYVWGGGTTTLVSNAPYSGFTGGTPHSTGPGTDGGHIRVNGGVLEKVRLGSAPPIFGGSAGANNTGGSITVNFGSAHGITSIAAGGLALTTGTTNSGDSAVAVPEPSGFLFSLIALCSLVWQRRRNGVWA